MVTHDAVIDSVIKTLQITAAAQKDIKKELKILRKKLHGEQLESAISGLFELHGVKITSIVTSYAAAASGEAGVAMAAVMGDVVKPTAAYLTALADDAVVTGGTIKEVFTALTDAQQLEYVKALRLGRAIGESVESLTERLAPLLNKNERDTRFLVNTSVQSVANAARERVMLDNADVASRITFVSTLDNKTCPACGFRDNKQWLNSSNHEPVGVAPPYLLPPVHINCRCTIVPDIDINVSHGTRASMDGATLDTSFEAYAKRKGKKFMDENLGVGRTEMLLSGKITYQQLFDNVGNLKKMTEL